MNNEEQTANLPFCGCNFPNSASREIVKNGVFFQVDYCKDCNQVMEVTDSFGNMEYCYRDPDTLFIDDLYDAEWFEKQEEHEITEEEVMDQVRESRQKVREENDEVPDKIEFAIASMGLGSLLTAMMLGVAGIEPLTTFIGFGLVLMIYKAFLKDSEDNLKESER